MSTDTRWTKAALADRCIEAGERWTAVADEDLAELLALAARVETLERRLTAIAAETEGHQGLGLIHHYAIGTHDAALAPGGAS